MVSNICPRCCWLVCLLSDERDNCLRAIGSVFFGQSFGGLDNEAPPKILYDLDEVFPSLLIEWQFAAIRPLLLAIPHKPMQHFLRIASEFYDVSIPLREPDRFRQKPIPYTEIWN